MKNENLPGYLHGEQLQREGKWCEFTLTIKEALAPNTVKAADGKLIDKAILVFENAEAHFVLGKTNERLVKAQLGNRPKDWIGQRITLYPVTGNWFGVKNAIAVRVRIPPEAPTPFIQPKSMGKDITGKKVRTGPQSSQSSQSDDRPSEGSKKISVPEIDETDYSDQEF